MILAIVGLCLGIVLGFLFPWSIPVAYSKLFSIALLASFLQPLLNDAVIAEMTCVGSLLIVGLGLNMLDLTKIKVMNLVPGIFLPILLCRIL